MSESAVFKCLVGFIVLVLVVGVVAGMHEVKEHSRLFNQCLHDGYKEYQCRAMLGDM